MANQIVKLKKGSDYLYPYADFMGIDISNILASVSSGASTTTYTATEDCYVFAWINVFGSIPNIDGVNLYQQNAPHSGSYCCWDCIPLKKGQALTLWANDYNSENRIYYKVFGIKR